MGGDSSDRGRTSGPNGATRSVARRRYLRALGATGVAGLAGCLDGGGGGGGGGGDGTGTPTGTTSGAPELVPGTAPGFPPFEMMEGGNLVGFDVDLLEAVAEAGGYEVAEWKTFEFKSLVPALTGDKIDVIAAAMSITEDRDETIDFSEPYYSVDQAILVRAGGDFSPSEMADLSGHPVGAQKGTTGEGEVKKLVEAGDLQQSNYKAYDSYVLAVEDLENGNIDAVVVDTPVADSFVAQRDVEVAFTVATGENYGFGIREGAGDLQSALNEGLATVRDDGTYQELTTKWFGSE